MSAAMQSTLEPDAPWMQMFTGRAVELLDPKPSQIVLQNIATSLSRIPRFNGHTVLPFSVAQHSCLCDDLLPNGMHPADRLWVLLHDAHEYPTGDTISPMIAAIQLVAGIVRGLRVDPMASTQDALQGAILRAAGLKHDVAPALRTVSKRVDRCVLML